MLPKVTFISSKPIVFNSLLIYGFNLLNNNIGGESKTKDYIDESKKYGYIADL